MQNGMIYLQDWHKSSDNRKNIFCQYAALQESNSIFQVVNLSWQKWKKKESVIVKREFK